MDYRYETKDEAREFHKQRTAFIIYENKIEFIEKSEISHFEYCQSKGRSKDTFNTITRGFYLNGDVVFYKDNFIYDKNIINEELKYLKQIADFCKADKMKIYFGLKVDKNILIWPRDYYYYYGEICKRYYHSV